MTTERLVEVFRALADPTRLAILQLLQRRDGTRCGPVQVGERGLCVCDVEDAVGLSQAAVSHHIGILKRAGLISSQKRGRWMFYRRNEDAIEAVAAAVVKQVEAPKDSGQRVRRRASGG